MLQIIDAVGYRPRERVLTEIVHIDLFGLLAPTSSGVLEGSDEFFLLRVDTDYGQALSQKCLLLAFDLAKLLISIRVRRPGYLFAIGFERVALLFE